MTSATRPTSAFNGSMRKYGLLQRAASHSVSASVSSGFCVPARISPAAPRRTSACWLEAPAPKRRITRSLSSAEINLSSRSQPSSSVQSSLPFHGVCGTTRVSATEGRAAR